MRPGWRRWKSFAVLRRGCDHVAVRAPLDPDVRCRDLRDSRRQASRTGGGELRGQDLPPLSDTEMQTVRRIYDERIRPSVHQRW